MTQKTVILCDWKKGDGDPCDAETPASNEAELPDEWGTHDDGRGNLWHLCPKHAKRTFQMAIQGFSPGNIFETVKHHHVGPDIYEEVYINGETLSISVQELIDEPPRDFPDYDHDADEGYHIGIFDHLHITVIGQHKDVPRVIVDSDEFPTELEVRDTQESFDNIDAPDEVR